MYEQIREDTLFLMLYAVVTTMAAVASVYLLWRRGNAFAEDITTPVRLRRWTAAFFAVIALGHVWYWPAMAFSSSEAVERCMLIGALLDCILTIPLALIVMLTMLQDRRRPLWPVWVAAAPLVLGVAACIATYSDELLPWMQGYSLLMAAAFTVYMVRAVRQYGRWLRDNYADLEHKEVWQSLLVLAAFMLLFVYYVMGYGSITYEYIIQVCGLLLICFLLWRVETLSCLTPDPSPNGEGSDSWTSHARGESLAGGSDADDVTAPLASWRGAGGETDDIERLLREHCIDTQLYLRHDLTVSELAQEVGTNRTYLRQYFSSQGTTYNAYINKLRIDHFIELYHEASATAEGQSIQAKQLAARSGYRSYSTFSLAFKQRMGVSVTAWMRAKGR